MTKQEFLSSLARNFERAMKLAEDKNADYASQEDPFRNFRKTSEIAGLTVEQGILVRLGDKISRISNLLRTKESRVKSESIEDTIIDAMNYLNIMLTWIQSQEPKDTDKGNLKGKAYGSDFHNLGIDSQILSDLRSAGVIGGD